MSFEKDRFSVRGTFMQPAQHLVRLVEHLEQEKKWSAGAVLCCPWTRWILGFSGVTWMVTWMVTDGDRW